MDGRLSWPGWFNHSKHFTHEVVTPALSVTLKRRCSCSMQRVTLLKYCMPLPLPPTWLHCFMLISTTSLHIMYS